MRVKAGASVAFGQKLHVRFSLADRESLLRREKQKDQ
jgi:hypothetical protein